MKNNIISIFGNPTYPKVLNNCIFYVTPTKTISINKVFLFINRAYYTIYKNGILYPIDVTCSKMLIKGYFEVLDNQYLVDIMDIDDKNDYVIKSYNESKIFCEINNVVISKTSYDFNSLKIKFEARSISYLLE